VYPLTLGSNIGTTTTSILASMAAGGEHVGQVRDAILFIFFTRFPTEDLLVVGWKGDTPTVEEIIDGCIMEIFAEGKSLVYLSPPPSPPLFLPFTHCVSLCRLPDIKMSEITS
jgi:hypothetical protein